jgi:hypothetical protein
MRSIGNSAAANRSENPSSALPRTQRLLPCTTTMSPLSNSASLPGISCSYRVEPASCLATMEGTTSSLELLVGDDRLHDFHKTPDQRELLGLPNPCDADAPQRLLPAQFMKSHTRHFEAQG